MARPVQLSMAVDILLSDPNPAGGRSFLCAGAQGSRSKPGSAKVDLAEAV